MTFLHGGIKFTHRNTKSGFLTGGQWLDFRVLFSKVCKLCTEVLFLRTSYDDRTFQDVKTQSFGGLSESCLHQHTQRTSQSYCLKAAGLFFPIRKVTRSDMSFLSLSARPEATELRHNTSVTLNNPRGGREGGTPRNKT